MGPLYRVYGEAVAHNLGRSLNAKVSSIISNGTWRWPKARTIQTLHIIENTPVNFLPRDDSEDLVIWLPSSNGHYSTRSTWKALRPNGSESSLGSSNLV